MEDGFNKKPSKSEDIGLLTMRSTFNIDRDFRQKVALKRFLAVVGNSIKFPNRFLSAVMATKL